MAVLNLTGVMKAFGDVYELADGNAYVAVSDIDLSVEEGEFVCILGPSGCGKSTLLNIIAGFDSPTAGEVTLDGLAVVRPGNDRVVLFQDANAALFPWMTAEENVRFGLRMQGIKRRQQRELVEEYLDLVGLTDHSKKYPAQLSGGMRQRVQIARGLALNPRILLMDEPFGALDALTRRRMQDQLLEIWSSTRKTIVFVTHDITESIVLADRVAVMSHGPAGTFREILSITLPRPRDPVEPEFIREFRHIEEMLYEEQSADE